MIRFTKKFKSDSPFEKASVAKIQDLKTQRLNSNQQTARQGVMDPYDRNLELGDVKINYFI